MAAADGLHVRDFPGADEVDTAKKGYWTAEDVLPHKRNCEEMGMTLESMMIPIDFYKKARFAETGRDQEIENVQRTIQAASAAGVHMMEWRFWPDFYWDDRVGYYHPAGRGGASYTANDSRIAKQPPFPEIGVVGEEMWKRFLYFAKPIVETAERAGVRLSMHPCDPPNKNMRGSTRIFAHPDGLRPPRGGSEQSERHHLLPGDDHRNGRRRVRRDRLLRQPQSRQPRALPDGAETAPKYTEVFIDEGDIDMVRAMKVWKDAGYSGPMVSDHTPGVEGDTPGGHVGRAFSLGFMRAAVQAVNDLS